MTKSQQPTAKSQQPIVDVAIAGGGVAGTALAVVLARAGVRVAVVEREARFRDRVRGDALFPWGAAEADRIGILDLLPGSGARPLPIWQIYEERQPRPPYAWADDVPTGDVLWGVDHPGLQETLFQQAGASGARMIRPARALRPVRMANGLLEMPVEAEGGPEVIRARLVIGAGGSGAEARRWIGAETVSDPVHHMLGGCLVDGVDLDPDAAHVGMFNGGMALIFRHGSGRARAYLVCQPDLAETIRGSGAQERFLAAVADALPEGAMTRARAVGPAAFFPARDEFADRIAGERIVLIGDAAGANDPARGQGLSIVLRDVRELSELLLAEDDWQAAIEAFARRRRSWFEPLRAHALWQGPLITDIGPVADARRALAKRAAELDPWREGYGAIYTQGPDGLPVNDAVRRHFLGEDLGEAATILSQ